MTEPKYPKFVVGSFPINKKGEIYLRTSPSIANRFTCINDKVLWGQTILDTLTHGISSKTGLKPSHFELLGLQDGFIQEGGGSLNHMIFADYLAHIDDMSLYRENPERVCAWHTPQDWLTRGADAFGPNIMNVIEQILHKNILS